MYLGFIINYLNFKNYNENYKNNKNKKYKIKIYFFIIKWANILNIKNVIKLKYY